MTFNFPSFPYKNPAFQQLPYNCTQWHKDINTYMNLFGITVSKYYFIIGIQPLGRFGQRPEPSQATGMALVRCILGTFLGVVCHCFPPRLGVPTLATRCLHVRHDARDPSGGRWNCGRECCPVILPKWRLPRHLGIFYTPQIYDMGPTALLPLRKEGVLRIFSPLKIRRLLPGFDHWSRLYLSIMQFCVCVYIYIYIYIYIYSDLSYFLEHG